jgi:hypothetical protein
MDNRHIVAFLSGAIGGVIPNNKSNIHPLLMGAIISFLATKVLIGDYDRGYKWSSSDIVFAIITIAEGVLGAKLANLLLSYRNKQ